MKLLSKEFFNSHENYKETSILLRRFPHSQLIPILDKFRLNKLFEISEIGKSIEGREILLLKIGTGNTKIFVWSQMHGDESTATMALLDVFNFFSGDDEFNGIRKKILNKVTIYFVPMLNPDGAERFKRGNSLNIDLNRDALRLQAPESRLLKELQHNIKPEFGFNLHDQNIRYSAGNSFKNATISLLAPPYNYKNEINSIRTDTMKLAVNIFDELSKFIPGHIGRWNDDFEPRAFGDNFVKWGTRSLLIESGGWKNDTEKQFIRKLNYTALLTGFQSIANGHYLEADTDAYFTIPENEKYLFNLLFRNLTLIHNGASYKIDIGINYEEKGLDDSGGYYIESVIEEVGDLSIYYGMEEYDCDGLFVEKGKLFENEFNSIDEIEKLNFREVYLDGYVGVKLKSESSKLKFSTLPINIYYSGAEFESEISPESIPNFIIRSSERIEYVIVNGFIYNAQSNNSNIKNGLLFR